jgi:alanine dehydrogenase
MNGKGGVANRPGSVIMDSTFYMTNSDLGHIREIVSLGIRKFISDE